jgi:hypothetical protein
MALPLGPLHSPLPTLARAHQPHDQVQPLHLGPGVLVVELRPRPMVFRSGEHQQLAVALLTIVGHSIKFI